MATLTEHIIKLTDHRDRELLELTLSKALIDLLRIDRVVVSKVVSEAGIRRWLDVTTLDARGGGKVVDPLRVDFDQLEKYEEHRYRAMCLFERNLVEHAWAGEDGPRISYLPLMPQPAFDELLMACDFNFVRGEDSLVRAIWAGNPFAWQLYPQHDGAHHDKLEAFLGELQPPSDWARFQRVWNGSLPSPLPALDPPCWQAAATAFRARLLAQPDLTSALLGFITKKR